jgi:hypothetical protein
MKKIILAILTILYMGASTGATVHLHYCMGRLAGWGLKHHQSKECGNCGMMKSAMDNGCCKDEQQFFKDNSDQKSAEPAFESIQFEAIASPVLYINEYDNNFLSVPVKRISFNTSPPSGSLALYIRNCVFRI